MGEEHAEKYGHVIAIMQDWEKYKPQVERYQQVCKNIEKTKWNVRSYKMMRSCFLTCSKRMYGVRHKAGLWWLQTALLESENKNACVFTLFIHS